MPQCMDDSICGDDLFEVTVDCGIRYGTDGQRGVISGLMGFSVGITAVYAALCTL